MATEKRTFPNRYFSWYNDDNRIAILCEETSTSSDSKTTEKYDTFQGSGSSGSISAFADGGGGKVLATSTEHGLSSDATNKDTVTIDSTSTNFDGSFEVTKVTKDTFTFEDTWVETTGETGSWSAPDVVDGLRITYHSKYEEITALSDDLYTNAGLDSGLHNALLCYVKSRIYEDIGNVQQAQYFYQMYENKVKKFRSRRSGVRFLSVPRL